VDNSPSLIGRPTWAEIDLDALAHNYRLIRNHVGDEVKVLAAVKANAYGHGSVECARRLEREGVEWFGVALPEEGIELRGASITRPILCLGGFWPGQEAACLQQKLTPVVYRLDMIESLDRAARDGNVVADVHVKVDTGMGRLGVRADEVPELCEALTRFHHVRVDGLMTHLAAADDETKEEFTDAQLSKFDETVAILRARGFNPSFIHAANSRRHLRSDEGRTLVRPVARSTALCATFFPSNIDTPQLQRVMSLHSRIMLLKKVPPGEELGYGCSFETRARLADRDAADWLRRRILPRAGQTKVA
jgi:alanine racemase